MGGTGESFRRECIGNIRLEFFTSIGSLTLEAWRGTRHCNITTFTSGVRRRTEVKLDAGKWDRLVDPIARSGFWRWEKRYDSHRFTMYSPSWSFNVMADTGWHNSSGDGEYPEGFLGMLRQLMAFSAEIEGMEMSPAARFLSPLTGESEA
ncbi:MAG: hypothetical protein MJZ38_06475 [archaeon]|nr:hypothetical protein [archaeon]